MENINACVVSFKSCENKECHCSQRRGLLQRAELREQQWLELFQKNIILYPPRQDYDGEINKFRKKLSAGKETAQRSSGKENHSPKKDFAEKITTPVSSNKEIFERKILSPKNEMNEQIQSPKQEFNEKKSKSPKKKFRDVKNQFPKTESGEKINPSPLKEFNGMYHARPARSVYNSPLVNNKGEPRGKDTSKLDVVPPSSDSFKENYLNSMPYYVSPLKTNNHPSWNLSPSPHKTVMDFVKESVLQPTLNSSECEKLTVTSSELSINECSPGTRLYPSLPRYDADTLPMHHKVEEKDLKEQSNRCTAIASYQSQKLPGPRKLSWTSSENNIEDTYDMDQFLEEALGSQMDLCSSVTSEPKMSCQSEEPLYSLDDYRTLTKTLSTSTMKSSMQQLTFIVPPDEAETDRVDRLMREADKQHQFMAQASKALCVCRAAKRFSVGPLVDGERLLLLATLRHQAALCEIQNHLSLSLDSSTDIRGGLCISEVTAPLKALLRLQGSKVNTPPDVWFICVLSCGEQIVASEAVAHESGAEAITFSSPLRLTNLPSTFVATLEIYSLRVHTPQDSSKSKVSRVYNLLRRQSKTCIGPASSEQLLYLRTPAFALAGTATLTLDCIEKPDSVLLSLEKVPLMSQLQGSVQLRLESYLDCQLETSGFLTVLELLGGCHTWHRRWSYLRGLSLTFWNYPSDQDEKEPLHVIDLQECQSNVQCAPRHLCPRARTLMLKTSRLPSPQDLNSTRLECNQDSTTVRHFLSCDTTAEMKEWSISLNKVLAAISTWKLNKVNAYD